MSPIKYLYRNLSKQIVDIYQPGRTLRFHYAKINDIVHDTINVSRNDRTPI